MLIFYQDLRSRSVVWLLFPIMALLGVLNGYVQLRSWPLVLTNTGINAGFLVVQFTVLQLYFIITRRSRRLLINKQLGLGDILFLLACCGCFSPANFLVFYCLGLLFALIVHLAVCYFRKNPQEPRTVPLAGYQAVFLLLFILFLNALPTTVTSDEWLLKYLLPA